MAVGRFVLGSAWVEIKADHSQLSSSSAVRDTEKHGEKHGKAFGSSFAGAATGIIAGLGITNIASKAIGFVGDSIAEAREAQKVGAQTEAVLKSTANAAGLQKREIEALSNAISKKTGIDDEAIQSNANMLLTFTNIKGAVYKDALPAVVDMTAAFNKQGEDGQAAAIQLGKALNDPIKGVTALRKVGVQLTDQQNEQIKTMVEAGNVAGAQGVILAEVQKEFGGSAEAQATSADKARVAFKNMQETIGNLLLPVLDKISNFITTTVAPAITGLVNGLKGEGITSDGLVGKMEAVGVVLRQVFGWLADHKELLKDFAIGLGVVTVAWGLYTVAAAAAAIATGAATLPIWLIVAAIGAVVAALIYSYQHFEGFRKVVDFVFHWVSEAVQGWWAIMGVVFDWLKTYAWPVAKQVFEDISRVITAVFDWLKPKIADWWAYISLLWDWFTTYAWPVMQTIWINIQNVITAVIDFIVPKIQAWWDFLRLIWDWITLTAWPAIEKFWNDLWAKISEVINFVLTKYEEFRLGLEILKTRIGEYLDTARQFFQTFKDKVVEIWNGLRDSIAKVWDQVIATGKAKINELGHLVNNVINAVNKIPFVKLPLLPEPLLAAEGGAVSGSLGGTGTAVFKREGGEVAGGRPGTDTVPAIGPGGRRYRLDNGEHIFTKGEVQNMGGQSAVYAFRKRVRDRTRYMASGGSIDELIGVYHSAGGSGGVTSTYRAGDPGYHGQSKAVDFGGYNQGNVAETIAQKWGSKLLELIHQANGIHYGIKNGQNNPDAYNALWNTGDDSNRHLNHLHLAANPGFTGAGGGGFSLGSFVSWLTSAAGKAAKAALDAALAPLRAALPDGDGVAPSVIRGVFQGIPDAALAYFNEKVAGAGGSTGDGTVMGTAYSVAKGMGASNKVLLALFEAGFVESGFKNLSYGDRDSLGFLQQRPSQGWPNPLDVATATRSFVSRAMGREGGFGNAGSLAQAIQVSAFPDRYNQRRGDAVSAIKQYDSGFDPNGYFRGGAIGMRGGGVVPGRGYGDKIPIMAEPGEIMVSNDDQRRGALGTTIVYRIDKVEVSARDVKEFKSVIDFFENVVQVAKTGVKG